MWSLYWFTWKDKRRSHIEVSILRLHRCWWQMLETECGGDNYEMLVTVLVILVTMIHYPLRLAYQYSKDVTNIEILSPTSKIVIKFKSSSPDHGPCTVLRLFNRPILVRAVIRLKRPAHKPISFSFWMLTFLQTRSCDQFGREVQLCQRQVLVYFWIQIENNLKRSLAPFSKI